MLPVPILESSPTALSSLAAMTTRTAEANFLPPPPEADAASFDASALAFSGVTTEEDFFCKPPRAAPEGEFSVQASTGPELTWSSGTSGAIFLLRLIIRCESGPKMCSTRCGSTNLANRLMTCCHGHVPKPKARHTSHWSPVSPSLLILRALEATTPRNWVMTTCNTKVEPETSKKSLLFWMPLRVLNSPRNFLEFHSLKSCIKTKVLKTIVKCRDFSPVMGWSGLSNFGMSGSTPRSKMIKRTMMTW
mmetsp:Transcript_95302/g.296727  ORF Transcript_95302/g.296727 Transcript_95302/m.296727 type:complete len:248 (+) Transcript_95302:323-1066(+)